MKGTVIMKNTIGFRDTSREKENEEVISSEPARAEKKEPVCCVAKIKFSGANIPLSYYNDEFYLEPGDKVFVTGKFYGQLGFVESVTTHFRIDKSKYKKVIGKPDRHIDGKFINIIDKMVSFDTSFDADRFGAIMIPPRDPDSDEEEEIICGEGWSVDLECFEESDIVDRDLIKPALDCCRDGKVLYLSVKDGKGAAYIKGRKIYKIDFSFDGETVSDLYCSCFFGDDCLCKHETAALITLRMLSRRPEFDGRKNFVAIDSDFFWNYISEESKEISLK